MEEYADDLVNTFQHNAPSKDHEQENINMIKAGDTYTTKQYVDNEVNMSATMKVVQILGDPDPLGIFGISDTHVSAVVKINKKYSAFGSWPEENSEHTYTLNLPIDGSPYVDDDGEWTMDKK